MRCGNCKQEHGTAEEVKACYASNSQGRFVWDNPSQVVEVKPKRTPPPAHVVSGPTQRQRNYIIQLLGQTGKTESDLPKPLDNMTFNEVSNVIESLLKDRDQRGPQQLIKAAEVPHGTYTVVFGFEDTITIRFRAPKTGKWTGTQLVEYLVGPDNDNDYRRCANFIDGRGYRLWSAFKEDGRVSRAIEFMSTSDKEGQIAAGEMYALQSTNCWRCGRTLTVEKSIVRGMGPVCARAFLG